MNQKHHPDLLSSFVIWMLTFFKVSQVSREALRTQTQPNDDEFCLADDDNNQNVADFAF